MEPCREPLGGQPLGSGDTLGSAPRGENDRVAELRQLPGGLEPQAPVGAGDDGDGSIGHGYLLG